MELDSETAVECELIAAMFEGCALHGRSLTVPLAPSSGVDNLRPCSAVLELALSVRYPGSSPPRLRVTAARGMSEREERELSEAARGAVAERAGERCCLDALTAAAAALGAIAERPGECAVCYEAAPEFEAYRAPCEHTYHAACLLRWRHAQASTAASAAPPPAVSGADARAHAASADLAQAVARGAAHDAHLASVRGALEATERQLAALTAETRKDAAHLARQARQGREALEAAQRERARLAKSLARLAARADAEAAAAEEAGAARESEAAATVLPCPVCRAPIGAPDLDELQRQNPHVQPANQSGAAPGRPARNVGRSALLSLASLLDAELLARVRAVQATHAAVEAAQAAAETADGGDAAQAANASTEDARLPPQAPPQQPSSLDGGGRRGERGGGRGGGRLGGGDGARGRGRRDGRGGGGARDSPRGPAPPSPDGCGGGASRARGGAR
jgi:hypothetical protein